MCHDGISSLADKVMHHYHEIRLQFLEKKRLQLAAKEQRTVSTREITLTSEEKKGFKEQAFADVLHDYPFEERVALKSKIGKELNRRKQERKANKHANLQSLVHQVGQRESPVTLDDHKAELAEIEEQLRQQEEIDALIQEGKAFRDDNDNLILLETAYEE